jgi:hypothetical protein
MKKILTGALCASTAILALCAFGCSSSGSDCLEGDNCNESGANANDPSQSDGKTGEIIAPACTDIGKAHVGLGDVELTGDRVMQVAFSDRSRTKPYSALPAEYARVLGDANKPGAIDQAGGTFGQPQDRWYLEPSASAVLLNTAYSVAFEGCLKMTGDINGGTADAKYATDPDANSARTECATWSRSFWSRDASPQELDACVSVIMTDSLKEIYPQVEPRDTTAKRRWAYGCASVLTSTGFLAY